MNTLAAPASHRSLHRQHPRHGGVGVGAPARGAGMTLAKDAGTAAIAAMFFLQGARLAPQAALAGARHWRLHALIFASTFLLFPIFGLALRALAPAC